jgi:hypothetical protein
MIKVALSLLLLLVLASPVSAKNVTTVSLDNTSPHYGDTVTYTVDTTVPHSVSSLTCYQNGNLVLVGGGLAQYTGHYSETVPLASQAYAGGAADCEVKVETWGQNTNHFKTIEEFKFTVAA